MREDTDQRHVSTCKSVCVCACDVSEAETDGEIPCEGSVAMVRSRNCFSGFSVGQFQRCRLRLQNTAPAPSVSFTSLHLHLSVGKTSLHPPRHLFSSTTISLPFVASELFQTLPKRLHLSKPSALPPFPLHLSPVFPATVLPDSRRLCPSSGRGLVSFYLERSPRLSSSGLLLFLFSFPLVQVLVDATLPCIPWQVAACCTGRRGEFHVALPSLSPVSA